MADRDANIKLNLQTDIGNSEKVLTQVSDRLQAINAVVKQSETAFAAWGEASKKAQSLSVFAEGYAYLQEDAAKAAAAATTFLTELVQSMEAAGLAAGKYALDVSGISAALKKLSLEIQAAKGAPGVLQEWIEAPGILDSVGKSAEDLKKQIEEAYEIQQAWSFLQEDTARALQPVTEIWSEWGEKLAATDAAMKATGAETYELAKTSDAAGSAMRALVNTGSVAAEMWKEVADTLAGPVKEAFRGSIEDTEMAVKAQEKLTEAYSNWKSEMAACVPGVQEVGDAIDWLKGRDKDLEERVEDLRTKFELLGTEDLQKLARAQRDAGKAAEEHEGALHKLSETLAAGKDKFDAFAERATDNVGRVLEATSKLVQATGAHEGEVWSNIEKWGLGAALEKIVDDIKKSNREIPDLLAQNENAQKVWNADTNDAQEEFLKKHKENQDKIGEVDKDFFEKTGKQLPQPLRNRYLQMGQEAGEVTRGVIGTMAAAGASMEEIQKKIGDSTDDVKSTSRTWINESIKMQEKFRGNFQGLIGSIPEVVPLIEQVGKAGNVTGEQLQALGKQYDIDVAKQKELMSTFIDGMGVTTQQIKDQTAEYEKLRKKQGEGDEDTIKAKAKLDALTKSREANSATAWKNYQGRIEQRKKNEADMIKLAEEMSKAYGGTRDEALKTIIAQSSADATTKAKAEERRQVLDTELQKNKEIAQTIISTANLTQTQLYSMLSNMDGITDKSEANVKRLIGERMALVKQATDQTKADEKAAAEETQKAVEAAEKAMQEAISAGAQAMIAENKQAFDDATEDIKRQTELWHEAVSKHGGDWKKGAQEAREGLTQQEEAYQAFSQSLEDRIGMATETTSRNMGKLKGAIDAAMAAGDTKRVEALSKAMTEVGKDSEASWKNLANEVEAALKQIERNHAAIIEEMKAKEKAFAAERVSNEEFVRDAIDKVKRRGANELDKDQNIITDIQRRNAEIEKLRATGKEEDEKKAIELTKKNISAAQEYTAAKVSQYDLLSARGKEQFDRELQNLKDIEDKDEATQKKIRDMEKFKSDRVTVIDSAQAQATSLAMIEDLSKTLKLLEDQRAQRAREQAEAQKAQLEEQKKDLEDKAKQVDQMMDKIKAGAALGLDTKKAEAQIDGLLKTGEKPIPITLDTIAARRQMEELQKGFGTGAGQATSPTVAQAEVEKITGTQSTLPNVQQIPPATTTAPASSSAPSTGFDAAKYILKPTSEDLAKFAKDHNAGGFLSAGESGGSEKTSSPPIVVSPDLVKSALKSADVGDLTGSTYKETEGLSAKVAEALDWASKLSARVERFGEEQAKQLDQTIMNIESGGNSGAASTYSGPDAIARATADAFAKTLDPNGPGAKLGSAFDPAVMNGFNDAVKKFMAAQKETKVTIVNKSDDYATVQRI